MLGFPMLYLRGMRILIFQLSGFYCIVEARKLEHDYPRALKVKYRGS